MIEITLTGIVSHKFEFPGSYFESDAQGGDFSEAATLYFEVGNLLHWSPNPYHDSKTILFCSKFSRDLVNKLALSPLTEKLNLIPRDIMIKAYP